MFLPAVQQADLLEDEPWDAQRRKKIACHMYTTYYEQQNSELRL